MYMVSQHSLGSVRVPAECKGSLGCRRSVRNFIGPNNPRAHFGNLVYGREDVCALSFVNVKAHASAPDVLNDRMSEFDGESNSTADRFAKEDAVRGRSDEANVHLPAGCHQTARQARLLSASRTDGLHFHLPRRG